MLSNLSKSIVALALALTATASVPGFSSAAIAAPVGQKKCPSKAHGHAKAGQVKTMAAKSGAAGNGGAQMRRSPDVQVISFGP
jgi:type IV secretory pathway VirB6-like protein